MVDFKKEDVKLLADCLSQANSSIDKEIAKLEEEIRILRRRIEELRSDDYSRRVSLKEKLSSLVQQKESKE